VRFFRNSSAGPGGQAAASLGDSALLLSETIARVLDCKITVSSAPRRGSRFRARSRFGRDHPSRQQAVARAVDGCSYQASLFCVDNEPAILDVQCKNACLRGWGCRVLNAPHLEAAIAGVAEAAGGAWMDCWWITPRRRNRPSARLRSYVAARRKTYPAIPHYRLIASRMFASDARAPRNSAA